MTGEKQSPDLGREDALFVQRIAEIATPPEMSPARRRAFDRRLEERLERRWQWMPVLAPAVAAAALALLVIIGIRPSLDDTADQSVARLPTAVIEAEEVDFEAALLAFSLESFDDEDVALPEDYLAIEEVFLGG